MLIHYPVMHPCIGQAKMFAPFRKRLGFALVSDVDVVSPVVGLGFQCRPANVTRFIVPVYVDAVKRK